MLPFGFERRQLSQSGFYKGIFVNLDKDLAAIFISDGYIPENRVQNSEYDGSDKYRFHPLVDISFINDNIEK